MRSRSSQANMTFEVGSIGGTDSRSPGPADVRLSTRTTIVGRSDLQPALLAVRCVLDDLEAHRRGPELFRALLVVDVQHDLLDSDHGAHLHHWLQHRYIHIGYITTGWYAVKPMTSTRSLPELTPAAFQVLLALGTGEAHGYAVMKFVEDLTDGAVRLAPGTLYRTMARLVAGGLVEETDRSDPRAPHDARRRYYRLTRQGRRVARDEAAMLARLVGAAENAGLLAAK